jgi:hypothetical protein
MNILLVVTAQQRNERNMTNSQKFGMCMCFLLTSLAVIIAIKIDGSVSGVLSLLAMACLALWGSLHSKKLTEE